MSEANEGCAGRLPVIDLRLARSVDDRPQFLSMQLLPTRGLMVLQVQAALPDGRVVDVLASPEVADATRLMNDDLDDFNGNASFAFGGAILAPFANRIRGSYSSIDRTVETEIGGRTLRLSANGGGKKPGAEQYAIHGMVLDRPAEDVSSANGDDQATASGVISAGDFDGRWVSSLDLAITWTLEAAFLELKVRASNVGNEELPLGLGWHPYFSLPSGRRDQATMHLPASKRICVNNYDEVLPTGELVEVADTNYDFRAVNGRRLGDLYLDDCFADLARNEIGGVVCEIRDPAASYGLRVTSDSEHVTALQTFAPLDRPFIVIEHQFNFADPFGEAWDPQLGTGMVLLSPGESVDYRVRLELFVP